MKLERRWLPAVPLAILALLVALADRGPIHEAPTPVLHRGHPLIIGSGIDKRRRTISVGVLVALSGEGATSGRALLDGLRYEIHRTRHSAALRGWRLRLEVRDTRGQNRRQSEVFPALARRVAVVGLTYGLPATTAILARARRLGLMVVPADARYAQLVRDPSIAILGAPYSVDAANAVSALGSRAAPVGLVRSSGAFDTEVTRGYQAAVGQAANLRSRVVQPARDAAGRRRAIAALHSAGARSVLVADPDAASVAALMAVAASQDFFPVWILVGPAWSPELVAAAPPRELRRARIAMSTVPWSDPAARRLRRLATSSHGRFDHVVQGAAIARLLEATVARALTDRDISARGILDARLRLGRVGLAGLMPALATTPMLPVGTRKSLLVGVDRSAVDHARPLRPFFTSPAGSGISFAATG